MSAESPQAPHGVFLDAEETDVSRTQEGSLVLRIKDQRWTDVQIRRVFPLTPTDRMIAFQSADDQYLGTLEDYERLGPASCRIVEEELAEEYFRPTIARINSLRKRFGMVEMDALTESGPRLIRFRSPRDDIRELGPGRFLLTDATGNRYEIPCLDALDDSSRKLWNNLV